MLNEILTGRTHIEAAAQEVKAVLANRDRRQ